jgi:hypothetical protein
MASNGNDFSSRLNQLSDELRMLSVNVSLDSDYWANQFHILQLAPVIHRPDYDILIRSRFSDSVRNCKNQCDIYMHTYRGIRKENDINTTNAIRSLYRDVANISVKMDLSPCRLCLVYSRLAFLMDFVLGGQIDLKALFRF